MFTQSKGNKNDCKYHEAMEIVVKEDAPGIWRTEQLEGR